MSYKLVSWAAAICISASVSLQGAMVNYNTGQGSVNSVDPYWKLTSIDPTDPPLPANYEYPNAYIANPHPAWTPNNAASKWITYSTPLYLDGDISREYTYELTFSSIAGTVPITWMSDNPSELFLDGTSVGTWGMPPNPSNYTPFQMWSEVAANTPFTLDLTAGVHTLKLVVENIGQTSGNPTGARVEFSAPVPEPSTILAGSLLLLPFGISTLRMLRKRN